MVLGKPTIPTSKLVLTLIAPHLLVILYFTSKTVFMQYHYCGGDYAIAFISCFQPIFIYISTVYIFAVNY